MRIYFDGDAHIVDAGFSDIETGFEYGWRIEIYGDEAEVEWFDAAENKLYPVCAIGELARLIDGAIEQIEFERDDLDD